MLAINAARNLRRAVGESAALGVNRIGQAAYQTHSSHGHNVLGKSKWVSQLLSYLRGGLGAIRQKPLAGFFSGTAAGRLRAAMPQGPGWIRGLRAKVLIGARQTAARTNYIRSISQRLAGLLRSTSAGSRLAGARVGPGRFAFGEGGKWSPYLNILSHNLRNLSSRGTATSAQVIMAQIHRQTVMGCMTQQRKGLAIALPRSQEAQARIFEAGLHRTEHSAAAAKFAAGKGAVPENNNATLSSQPGSAKAQLHPAAKAAQEAAVPSEQCVTITIPYTLPKTFGLLPENVQTSSADVAHLLADMQKAQSRHTLLLTRLIERLSATGWNVQYQQVTQHTECIEIAVAPSSGITKASDLDALLCSWGFDTSLIAAVIRDPRVPPSSSDAALEAGRTPARFAAAATDSSAASSLELDDLDSRMFSLIVDEVVDPDEAYREQVRDFLADLEIMPQLSGIRDMSLPATDKRARFGMTL